MTCSRCKQPTTVIVDYLCLKCRAEVLGPGDDREAKPITITFPFSLPLPPKWPPR